MFVKKNNSDQVKIQVYLRKLKKDSKLYMSPNFKKIKERE